MTDRSTHVPEDALQGRPRLSAEEVAAREASNGLLQFDLMNEMIVAGIGSPTRLTVDHVLKLQAIAIAGLEARPGEFRLGPVAIGGSAHVPPHASQVPRLVEEMCVYVNDPRWTDGDAIHLSAYTMWRLNWIHPFTNGNGRASRAISYLVLSVTLGFQLPGITTVPEMISRSKQPYYAALDAADANARRGVLDVSAMEALLTKLIMAQLQG